MKKILIVDDSKLNRTVLKSIIGEYVDDGNKEEIKIDEAEDGIAALELFKKDHHDLIFMDIMMPKMDGIEATAKIKEISKKPMIVAVSALDDEDSKSRILKNGAEDYIVKPVNGEILKKRLGHYLTIISARNEKKFNIEPINVLDHHIYSRRLIFLVDRENALAEFWEYYLSSQKANDELTDLIRILYGIGAWQLKLKFKFQIVVEESEDRLFFTINNMKLLKKELIESIIKKNYPKATYKIEEDKLSFAIKKMIQEAPQTQDKISEEPIDKSSESDEIIFEQKEIENRVYDFIDPEDLEELETIATDLNSLMLLVGSSKLELQEIKDISSHIERFAKILCSYHETYDISQSLDSLAKDIIENANSFIERSKDIASLCMAFNNDLLLWIRKLFYEGAPSIDFLDKSIISNASMISNFIKPQATESVNVDDIFDF